MDLDSQDLYNTNVNNEKPKKGDEKEMDKEEDDSKEKESEEDSDEDSATSKDYKATPMLLRANINVLIILAIHQIIHQKTK